MELKIYSPTEDGFIKAIDWNHEEIKKEVAEKVSYYANLFYTDDQIKDAKADRAKLNKFVQALETKRKEVKKQCLSPYESFEKQMKEITSVVNEAIQAIDQQVKGYEEKKKADKLTAIRGYWNSCEKPFEIDFDTMVLDYKWLNATSSLKSAYGAIDVFLETINKDLATLQNLPEFGFEATEVYKTTLDLGKAIQEGHRLAEIQKRKLEHEAAQERMKAEAEAKIAEIAQESVKPAEAQVCELPFDESCALLPFEELPTQPLKEWISFKALLTTEDALALKAFFNSRRIEFEAI